VGGFQPGKDWCGFGRDPKTERETDTQQQRWGQTLDSGTGEPLALLDRGDGEKNHWLLGIGRFDREKRSANMIAKDTASRGIAYNKGAAKGSYTSNPVGGGLHLGGRE